MWPYPEDVWAGGGKRTSVPFYTVDAFSEKPFGGNPAAVCIVESGELSAEQMQAIAAEINLSETAFVEPLGDESWKKSMSKFKLRWMTPICEVDLCGHATLATAAVLYNELGLTHDSITFSTLSGDLLARREGSKICIDLPLNAPVALDRREVNDVIQLTVGDLPLADCQYSARTKKLLLRLADSCSLKDLQSLSPESSHLLSTHNGSKYRGVIVTLKSSEEKYDFLSRYFAPWNGISEDPVTGSAHTVLTPYWSEVLNIRNRPLHARQCSKRGGDLELCPRDDGRVDIFGGVTVVARGFIYPFAKC